MKTLEIAREKAVSPGRIIETGTAFMASKTLLTAIKFDLFTLLGEKGLPAGEIRERLHLHQRSLYDFLDALVALGFLERVGTGADALYQNTEETGLFLNKNKPSCIGGFLEMANDRLYRFWNDLEMGLRTGKPQNEVKYTGKPVFEAIYANPAVLRQFMEAMAGIQTGTFTVLAQAFDFENYSSLCDIGGANGALSVCVAREHPNLRITSVDLPAVEPIARENVEKAGFADQITLASLDIMRNPFPKADLITMGNILHDWDLSTKKQLIRKAFEALPKDGALVVIENIIDDERKYNAFGLLISLNMLIETDGGFDYTHTDFHDWALGAGFRATAKIPLSGPSSALVAYK
jgi:precorrin-6B methylase 2